MKQVIATWSVEMNVICPYCEEYQEVEFEKIDEWYEIFPFCKSEKMEYPEKVKCTECGKEFEITETEY